MDKLEEIKWFCDSIAKNLKASGISGEENIYMRGYVSALEVISQKIELDEPCDLEQALETTGKDLYHNGKYVGVIK